MIKRLILIGIALLLLIALVALFPRVLTWVPVISSEWIGPAKTVTSFNQLQPQEKFHVEEGSKSYSIDGEVYNVSPLTVAVLKDARIYRRAGFVITNQDALYENNANCWDYNGIWQTGVMKRLFLPRVQRYYNERVAVASTQGSQTYYHWMIELMPKILLLKECGCSFDKIYLPKIIEPFQKETLELLGIDKSKWIESDDRTMIKAKEVIVPSRPGAYGWCCHLLTPWIVEKLNSLYPDTGIEPTRKIYISRKRAMRRRILNEDELMKVLEKHHFEVVYFEGLSVKEQVDLIRSAKVVLAPHGGGLTNLIFAHPKITLIEIFHPQQRVFCFKNLAFFKQMNYVSLNSIPQGGEKDSTVNVAEIDEVLTSLVQ
ncbi:MAG: glycosyltransferase family 61 protein [Chlamydiales bacterium]|nr:glycosyltransferase family 61 protein [Chlamydiales bacterium]